MPRKMVVSTFIFSFSLPDMLLDVVTNFDELASCLFVRGSPWRSV